MTEALKILSRKDENYEPAAMRADGDWAAVLFKETLQVKLFPTLERVGMYFGNNIYWNSVAVSPSHLSTLFTDEKLYEFWKEWFVLAPYRTSLEYERRKKAGEYDKPRRVPAIAPKNSADLAQAVWDLIQAKADRIRGVQTQNGPHEELYVIRIDRMQEQPDVIKILPKQCRLIAETLVSLGKGMLSEEELENMMRDLHRKGVLKTKQRPFRIFQYYAPVLGDRGFLYYPSKRHKQEDFVAHS